MDEGGRLAADTAAGDREDDHAEETDGSPGLVRGHDPGLDGRRPAGGRRRGDGADVQRLGGHALGAQRRVCDPAGGNVYVGTEGDDVIVASGDRDLISVRGGNDTICAGGGDGLIDAGTGADVVFAGAGNDELHGEGGPDRLFGQPGVDSLDGQQGRDFCDGGRNNDFAPLSGACEQERSIEGWEE